MSELRVVLGVKHDMHPPPVVDPMVWQNMLGVLWRRGERTIPWRTGRKGTWSVNDRFEEIYLDDFSRAEILRLTGKAAEFQVRREKVKTPKTLEKERRFQEKIYVSVCYLVLLTIDRKYSGLSGEIRGFNHG
jgi:hypothetical protein